MNRLRSLWGFGLFLFALLRYVSCRSFLRFQLISRSYFVVCLFCGLWASRVRLYFD